MTQIVTEPASTEARDVVILKIRRFDPERDSEPHWELYEVPFEPGDRLLDALHYVKWNIDGSLTFCRSGAPGVWGSEEMRIKGAKKRPRKSLVQDLADRGDEIGVEPIKGLPVNKDL